MDNKPFRSIPANDAFILITAMLVCAQNNDVKGVAELAIQLGIVMSEIDNLILSK